MCDLKAELFSEALKAELFSELFSQMKKLFYRQTLPGWVISELLC